MMETLLSEMIFSGIVWTRTDPSYNKQNPQCQSIKWSTFPAIIIGTVRSLWTWLWGRFHVPQNVLLGF